MEARTQKNQYNCEGHNCRSRCEAANPRKPAESPHSCRTQGSRCARKPAASRGGTPPLPKLTCAPWRSSSSCSINTNVDTSPRSGCSGSFWQGGRANKALLARTPPSGCKTSCDGSRPPSPAHTFAHHLHSPTFHPPRQKRAKIQAFHTTSRARAEFAHRRSMTHMHELLWCTGMLYVHTSRVTVTQNLSASHGLVNGTLVPAPYDHSPCGG